ncbi:thaumatin [Gorgonomyces haynaldii]|nr:thaumatin [Gorgonomyces haynaldii]
MLFVHAASIPCNATAPQDPIPQGSVSLPSWLPARPGGKNIIIHNSCKTNIWPGYVGTDARSGQPIWGDINSPNPAGNKIPLKPNEYRVLPVYDGAVAVRVWARQGCKQVGNRFVCEIGDCGNGVNNFDGSCFRGSGIGGYSLAEFTFDLQGTAFYDLSLVDGYTLPISISLLGETKDVPNVGSFSCGNPACRPKQDFSECPPETTKRDENGIAVACFNIHTAAADAQMRSSKIQQYSSYLSNIWNDASLWTRAACDALVGDCGGNNVQETLYSGAHIKRGGNLARIGGDRTGCACSPYVDWIAAAPEMKPFVCYDENKPKPLNNFGNGKTYSQIFKSICPMAYSWQFDDNASTFQCKGDQVSYIVDFCS